jgi:hypothetical protein
MADRRLLENGQFRLLEAPVGIRLLESSAAIIYEYITATLRITRSILSRLRITRTVADDAEITLKYSTRLQR